MVTLQVEEEERRRIRNLDMEDVGIRKPSANEKLVAARTKAYQVGNVLGVQTADARIAKRQTSDRRARRRKNARKREPREYCRELDFKNRIPGPRSDDDDRAPVA